MANIFVLIVVIFGVCSFGLCVCFQTLTSSWLAQSLKKFQNLDPLKLTFHKYSSTLELVDNGLKHLKTPELVEPRVQEILCENHGLLVPPLMNDFVVEYILLLPMTIHVVASSSNKQNLVQGCGQNFDMESLRNCPI